MPSKTTHTAHNCVQSLFDTLIDISEGYTLLIERAEPSIRAFIRDLADQHTRDISVIDAQASAHGFELDRSGTVMSEVHKAAVKLRDLFSDLDRTALEAVAEGEENVVKRYDDAIKCLSPDDTLHTTLVEQRSALRSKIADIFEAV
ncbi:MAG: PA2169 family four-helix-bundle protein [Marivita sp.]|uniref:DUF2383 domain-containing protein n=1 Tax=Marivita sp. TaxID=2003365 RepID=UPI0025B89E85|nr:DUF2383 domain-containing protein [Marivita sp.]MCI5111440.1 PA2169 family four-helix-bundle protein [Marivita sp.]